MAAQFGQLADRAAAKEGEASGRAAGLDPEFQTQRGNTIRSEAFDAAGLQVAETRLRTAMADGLEAAAQKHGDDPTKLGAVLSGVGRELIASAPRELQPDLELRFDGQRKGLMRTAARRQVERHRAEQASAMQQDLSQSLKQLSQQSYALGLDGESSRILGAEMQQLAATLARRGVDGQPLVAPAQAQKIIEGAREEVAQARLLGAFERLPGLEAKRRFIADFENGYSSGKGVAAVFDFRQFRQMQSALEVGLRQTEARASVELRTTLGGINDAYKRVTKGYVLAPDDLAGLKAQAASIADPTAQAAMARVENEIRVQARARVSKPSELNDAIVQLRDDMRTGSTTDQETRLEMLSGLRDEMAGALKKNPHEWADRVGVIDLAPIALPQPGNPQSAVAFQASIKLRIAQSEDIAKFYGLEQVQYLQPEERQAFAGVMQQGGAQALQTVSAIVEASGRGRAVSVMSELALNGSAPALASVGALVARLGPVRVAREVFDAFAMRQVKGVKLPDVPSEDADRAMAAELETTFRAVPQAAATLSKLAQAAYQLRATNAGLTTFDAATYRAVVRELVGEQTINGVTYGGVTDIDGGWLGTQRVVVPHDVRTDAFEDLRREIKIADLPEPPRTVSGRIATEAQMAEASLISLGDGRYYLSASEDQDMSSLFRNADGQPFVLNFADVRQKLKTKRPDLFLGGE